ncbi:IucA/IucC family protein [Actinomadura atramentaria]|uniref:IucA/IucC family protein n=1 Tax=Actinomadura atramentaria TaxID=1990 RepID=UPI00036D84B9|nr:IucA/IucC family protein [Actinomadura atramentaria]
MLLTHRTVTADEATATALLNCLVREVCAPDRQVWADGRRLVLRLPRAGVLLRAGLARPPVGPTFRLVPPVEERRGDRWAAADWERLADLAAGELELATGRANPEFPGQVRDSHAALDAILAARAASPAADADPYLASERSLVAGHRFHPSPKARQGAPADWLPYAPETGTRFRARWLAVRADALASGGDGAAFAGLDALGPPVPAGYRALPVHPWQFALLADRPVLRRALAAGLVRDLGAGGPELFPTASVRTVYAPAADVFLKFSLDVRITNCVRKNAWYELDGAVLLDRLLRPVFARLDGCALLAEPAYRTAALADARLYEGFGTILREGVGGLAGTPLLAAALADPYGTVLASLPPLATPDGAARWWDAYVRLLLRPVLAACLDHGVILEPHLQNVLMAVDGDGMPVQAVFRDLEGTKLTAGRWDLRDVDATVRDAVAYDAERGWNRVVYCLFVNHLAEVAAAVADLHPALDRDLWRAVRRALTGSGHADRPGVRALLAGVPFPAKANLRARWSRSADRAATYVPARNPL